MLHTTEPPHTQTGECERIVLILYPHIFFTLNPVGTDVHGGQVAHAGVFLEFAMATESPNEFFTRLVWANLWNPQSPYYLPNVIKNGINQGGVKVDPMGNITVASVPASGSIELMKSDNLASWLPVKTGYVGIEFSNILIQGLDTLTDGGLTYTDNPNDPTKGSISAKINVPTTIQISGNYTVVASGLAQCALDTAGALSFLPIPTSEAGAKEDDGDPTGNANDNDPLDQYLDAARAQRTKLWQTPNGGAYMDSFYDNNETYNWLFQNDQYVQTSWKQPANKQYLTQTYNASNNPDVPVNPTSSSLEAESNGMSYNANAFAQQVVVVMRSLFYSKTPPPVGSITSGDFQQAAGAATSFGGAVQTTGNSSTQANPMSVNGVYSTIATTPPDQSTLLMATEELTMESFEAQLTDFQRTYLKKIEAEVQAQQMLQDSNDASATLIQGTISLTLSGGSLTLGANLTFPTTGNPSAAATGLSANVNITNLTIKNISDWYTGAMSSIGHQLDQALENSDSVRNLIADKVNDALGSDTVLNYLTSWLNNTLAKVLGPLTGEK